MPGIALILLLFAFLVRDEPLQPAWSPDRQILATTDMEQRYVTPNGAGFVLLLNDRPVYPAKEKRKWFAGYKNIHTFLSELAWSPDSQNVAFVEKIFDWEYLDPFNGYFDGTVTRQKFYLVIVSREGKIRGYQLKTTTGQSLPQWRDASDISLNNRRYDLRADPPLTIR